LAINPSLTRPLEITMPCGIAQAPVHHFETGLNSSPA
jgi:hypothetical protein